jgi:hypothetical protein
MGGGTGQRASTLMMMMVMMKLFKFLPQNVLVLLHIREVPGSNLGLKACNRG